MWLVNLGLSEAETEIVLRMMQAGGWSTVDSLMRSALQKQADILDLDRPGTFLKGRRQS